MMNALPRSDLQRYDKHLHDNFSGADKDYISGKDLILSIVPETYSLVCTI